MSHCHCCQDDESRPRRRRGLLGMLVQIAVLYVALLFGGGTLINTGHPVAVETGRLIHTVLFVQPTINWAENRDLDPLSHGLRMLSHGFPIHHHG